jgi:membrane protein insertase Oxa1/YidC/SpoIIIJ
MRGHPMRSAIPTALSICFLIFLFGAVLITPNTRARWFTAMGVSTLSPAILLVLA